MDKKERKAYLSRQKQKPTFCSKVTVNWKGKEDIRGLSETAMETLIRVGESDKANELKKKYHQLQRLIKNKKAPLSFLESFTFEEELTIVKDFVIVRL